MTLNATLLVQLLNFGIAYCLLRFFFFKPIVGVLHREDEEKKQHHHEIQIQQDKLAQYDATKHDEWRACCRYFKRHMPPVLDTYVGTSTREAVAVEEVPQEELRRLREEVTHKIVTGIDYAS